MREKEDSRKSSTHQHPEAEKPKGMEPEVTGVDRYRGSPRHTKSTNKTDPPLKVKNTLPDLDRIVEAVCKCPGKPPDGRLQV